MKKDTPEVAEESVTKDAGGDEDGGLELTVSPVTRSSSLNVAEKKVYIGQDVPGSPSVDGVLTPWSRAVVFPRLPSCTRWNLWLALPAWRRRRHSLL